jgi:hypothetical protein
MSRRFPITDRYIATKPRFALTRPSFRKLRGGQMTIIFGCLEKAYPESLTLDQLVNECGQKYRDTFRNRNTNIHKSILHQLNLIEPAHQV